MEPRTETRVTVVVPVRNAMQYLPRTAPSVMAAARRTGGVEIVYVDNGSTDGSLDYLERLSPDLVRVARQEQGTIASLRNWGAAQGTGAYLCFLDADCAVVETYFTEGLDVLQVSGADATGCEVHLPENPQWIEQTLHDLHYQGRDQDVVYINSANFWVSRHAFATIGGFRSELRTGEDADIGHRLVDAGFRIRESPRVRAIHHGNPKSLPEFYRRSVWHALGMFATVTTRRIDRPTLMMALHVALTIAGGMALVLASMSLPSRIALGLLSQLVVPVTTVGFRMHQTRRVPRLGHAVLLYWLYYWARIHALLLVSAGRASQYRK